MASKRSSPKNQVLKVPDELQRIADLRARLAGTDRDDHLDLLDSWEKKVKKAFIFLSLERHEGVGILLDKCDQELEDIDEVLRAGSKPKELSPDGAMAYTMEQYALHQRKELWEWLRSLFTDAKRDIREVKLDLDGEDALEEESGLGI